MQTADAVGYVAFVDEAGDNGIRRVRPVDPTGGSEWFTLGALVVPLAHVDTLNAAIEAIRESCGLLDRSKPIHFNKLENKKRLAACEIIAQLNVRCFWVVSHKANMRGYRNDRANIIKGDDFFYNWMARLLLERISHHCLSHSMSAYHEPRTLRVKFSARSYGMKAGFRRYISKLKIQSTTGNLFINTGDIAWSVIDDAEMDFVDWKQCPELQLADIVASGFYKGLALKDGKRGQLEYINILARRVAKNSNGRVFGHGVKLMPKYAIANLAMHQREIFELFRASETR